MATWCPLARHVQASQPAHLVPLPLCCAASSLVPRSYLPEASVAFVDEIFKANSAILNTLLTILNERLFDNGAKRVQVPLLCLVSWA